MRHPFERIRIFSIFHRFGVSELFFFLCLNGSVNLQRDLRLIHVEFFHVFQSFLPNDLKLILSIIMMCLVVRHTTSFSWYRIGDSKMIHNHETHHHTFATDVCPRLRVEHTARQDRNLHLYILEVAFEYGQKHRE